jgi:DNA-binding response OmpR family regulator
MTAAGTPNDDASHLLVVDDDTRIRDLLNRYLKDQGFRVTVAGDADEARRKLRGLDFDLIIMDVMMPGESGLSLTKSLREIRPVPILMLTALAESKARIEGLEAGADDYLSKPFCQEELLARLRALLRRSHRSGARAKLRFGDLQLDPVEHQVIRDGRAIELTRTEFLLLELFLRHPRQVLTRAQIFERVWGYDFGPASNSLEVYVGYLRRKTEANGEPRVLHTVRGIGYVLRAP